MNKIFFCLSILFTTFFVMSCSENLVAPKNSDSTGGQLSVSLDKESMPSDVSSLKFYLTRDGYSSITKDVQISGESDYELLIESISAGVWKLEIDALDIDSEVLYEGETDIEIIPGEIVYVSLTLSPVESDSAGIIHIRVNWGTNIWTDYPANPIFSAAKSPMHPNGIVQAKVIYDNNIYKMWYSNLYDAGAADIGYAESVNGIIWNSVSNLPAIGRGASDMWDSYAVQGGVVVKVDNLYRLYYSGMATVNGLCHIGMATSSDGKNWVKRSAPVLYTTENETGIHVEDIVIINNKFYMYFSIGNNSYRTIGLAISNDGINWERYSGNPILTGTSGWENNGAYFPSVINEGNYYKMVYMNQNATGFGFAKSTDGIHWEKDSGNPFFNTTQTHNLWSTDVAYPYFRKFNDKYYIYYTGSFYSGNAIGLVTK